MPELRIGKDGEIRTYGTFVSAAKEKRAGLLDFLEAEGFTYDPDTDREDVLESRFPISLNLEERRMSRMGSVTTAAGAASAKLIMNAEEFYELYAKLQASR